MGEWTSKLWSFTVEQTVRQSPFCFLDNFVHSFWSHDVFLCIIFSTYNIAAILLKWHLTAILFFLSFLSFDRLCFLDNFFCKHIRWISEVFFRYGQIWLGIGVGSKKVPLKKNYLKNCEIVKETTLCCFLVYIFFLNSQTHLILYHFYNKYTFIIF